MNDYEFTLVFTGDLESDEILDALFEAGCDDATFGSVDGVGYADFFRHAPSFSEAVRSSIDQIESVPGLRVLRAEPDDLVTMNEIAERMGRSRESVRLLIKGARGPGDFPPPASHLKARSRLWRWSEVATWASETSTPVDLHAAAVIAAVNAALTLRETAARLTQEEWRLVGSSLAPVESPTHEVFNQPPPLQDYNPYLADAALREAVHREGAAEADGELSAFGEQTGREDVIRLGHLANRHPPELRTHDRCGRRIDEVEFHPGWHELLRIGVEAEIHALPWNRRQPGAHVTRAAKHFLFTQVEAGVHCPLTMTFAAVPALERQGELAAEWVPRLTSAVYDPRSCPAAEKTGALMGMAMTEKQGGSDVRANTTRARATGAGGPGGEYLLDGHKWFCSAPMCDAFLTLAHTEAGLSCFLVPRWLPDGSRNRFAIQRLKDKLGNRSNASSEIEYHGTWSRMVGEDGRGIPTILEMVAHTRLDCMIGSAALMRQALAQAIHHASHRSAFGKLLKDQPLMKNVLADLALESEAATALTMRVARAYDQASEDPAQRAFRRLATAVGKYWVTKRGPGMVCEALECHGGNGYVEESIMPRIYREIPLSSIWEGSGNVMCLDVLRALGREPETLPALLAELAEARGADRRFDAYLAELESDLGDRRDLESRARRVVEKLALALQGALLVRHAPSFVADAFCASRLAGERGSEYGTLPSGIDFEKLVERASPADG